MTKEQEKFVKDWGIGNYQITEDNLTVGGSLDLRGTNITSLPDNLTVGGSLDLEGTSITSNKISKPSKDFMRQFKLDVEKQLCWKNGTYRKIDGIFVKL